MKSLAIAALMVALAGCSSRGAETEDGTAPSDPARSSPPTQFSMRTYNIIGPLVHENLEVFLFEEKDACPNGPDYLILEEALKEGTLRVTEQAGSAQVNLLEIENVGEHPVYIQAGDTVKGGQQDRTIAVDVIIPPKSGKMPVGAFCVEPGRWSSRSVPYASPTTNQFGALAFSLSEVPAATKEQKLAIRLEKSQAMVWRTGKSVIEPGRTLAGQPLSDSYVLATEEPGIRTKIEEYVDALRGSATGKNHVIGMAFAVNGEPDTIDLYGSSSLFLKLWPKLLRGAALEALTKKRSGGPKKSVHAADLAELLEKVGRGERKQQKLPGDLEEVVYDGPRAVVFDTVKNGALLHRQLIAK